MSVDFSFYAIYICRSQKLAVVIDTSSYAISHKFNTDINLKLVEDVNLKLEHRGRFPRSVLVLMHSL